MSYATAAPVPWPIPPDWREGVREQLASLTDYLPARSGETQKRALRMAPRRRFDFITVAGPNDEGVADAQARRVLDALLFDQGGQLWALPVWHDVQLLAAGASSGASSVACRTADFEFVAGGQAILWRSVNSFELVTIDTVESDHLALTGTLAADWPAGTRLYPVVDARNIQPSQESAWNDTSGARQVTFIVDTPCDWPAVAPTATYRGYPVLEHRTDEGDDPTSSYLREIQDVDADTGGVTYFDYVDAPKRLASHQWLASSRAEHAALRSLLYWLDGRDATLWVPSLSVDLVLASSIASDSTALVVEWAGYTVFGRQQSNRRDLRIELVDGTVLYRRINGSAEGGATETLTLDSAPGVDIAPGDVRLISFMTLSEGASDTVELNHVTDADGLTRCALQFQGVKHVL